MNYTNHERVRVASGFQSRYSKVGLLGDIDGSNTIFYVDNDEYEKIVPDFATGNSYAGVSDVKVFQGVSGGYGMSRIGVSRLDWETGMIELDTAPDTGVSVVVTYASSSVPSQDITSIANKAEGIVNTKLAECYSIPLTKEVPAITALTEELCEAILLSQSFGANSRELGETVDTMFGRVYDRLDMLCDIGNVLVDIDGSIVGKAGDSIDSNVEFVKGGRVSGRLFDMRDESFKKYKPDSFYRAGNEDYS